MGLDDFLRRWTARRDELAGLRASVEAAPLIDQILTELRDEVADHEEATLTLSDAALRSGYSRDHLARLVRQHRIPNRGRRGAPRVRLGALPIRPGARANDDADPAPRCYDPLTDARSLASRRLGASNGRPDSTR
ncbi:MAG TPA: hypothetical protein VFA43_00540 [Gemmatimonadaceae bacterium]|nr:hypothetical protein [Gemmatimonadaceae bacterium]